MDPIVQRWMTTNQGQGGGGGGTSAAWDPLPSPPLTDVRGRSSTATGRPTAAGRLSGPRRARHAGDRVCRDRAAAGGDGVQDFNQVRLEGTHWRRPLWNCCIKAQELAQGDIRWKSVTALQKPHEGLPAGIGGSKLPAVLLRRRRCCCRCCCRRGCCRGRCWGCCWPGCPAVSQKTPSCAC